MDKWESMEYCTACREYHLFNEEGQVDRCKDYRVPIIDFSSVVKELAEQLTRKSHVKSVGMVSSNNKRGSQ
jgi:hypothetical protein